MGHGKVAIIGGSGIKESPSFDGLTWSHINVGPGIGPQDGGVYYRQSEDGVIFIPRHGHELKRYGPCVTQYGANLLAAKMLGASTVIATSAVGSLHPERFCVESLVVPHDYIDETGRDDNLFGAGVVVHANPRPAFSERLRQILIKEARKGTYFRDIAQEGTYVTIPGDRFGTAAEGRKRKRYADIVGMTICPEASMAMQLGLHYAVASFVVDGDTDANHTGGTLEVMRRLSTPEKVPAYITRVIPKAKEFAKNAGPLEQLVGNIIPGDTSRIENKSLRRVADELIGEYCG